MKFKFLNLIVVLTIFSVSTIECGFLRNTFLNRRSRDADDDTVHDGSVMDVFGSFMEDVGLKNVFRDVRMKMLSASEQLLEQSTNIYDNFQDTLSKSQERANSRSSEFRQALRYLQTEARRRREDIEDEIEIEKEKELEAKTEKEKEESKNKLKKLNMAFKQMDEISKTKLNSLRDRVKNKRANRKSLLNRRKSVEKENKTDDETVTERSKRASKKKITLKKQKSTNTEPTEQEKPAKTTNKKKDKTKNINPDAVQSAGDGFGDH